MRAGAPPAESGAKAADPFADGRAEHVAGSTSAAQGSMQVRSQFVCALVTAGLKIRLASDACGERQR